MKNLLLSFSLNRIRNFLFKFKVKMSSPAKPLLAPIGVRGMKNLDREKFQLEIKVPVLNVPTEKVSKIIPVCKQYLLKLENFRPIQNSNQPSEENKCIHLDPIKVSKWLDILENDRLSLEKHNVNEDQFKIKNLKLTYDNFKYDTIFKAVLPENDETVSGFSQVGHIIHLNLKEHLLEYSSLIGQVLIDKIKSCRTVVNKTCTINNTYRNFNMDVIAGDDDFLVSVKESGCNFQFDFSKVYWNPRLGKEHERIVQCLKPGDILFDVFSGVGPFSIPAAKRNCRVYANDLNPESFKWLNHNAKENKVLSNLKTYCVDGKDFICNTIKNFIIDCCTGKEKLKSDDKIHITMNLPSKAVEFLKYFKGLIDTNDLKDKFDNEIIVYVYCFAFGDQCDSEAKQMVNENIEMDISSNIIDIFDVRNVSPKKEMIRVTFKLTKDILFYEKNGNELEEPPIKKICSRETDN